MIGKRNNSQATESHVHKDKESSYSIELSRESSINESHVPSLLDKELKKWIKVVQPARASLFYERME